MAYKTTVIRTFSWFLALTAPAYAVDPSHNQDALSQPLTHIENQHADGFDEKMERDIRHRLESMYVEEVRLEDTNPEPGTKVIRRTWDDYAHQFNRRHIVLFSGHQGMHGKTYGTTQGPEYYMIDNCWEEVAPDAVLDVTNPLQMRYIPNGQVDTIVADDQRFLSNETIASLLPTLKPGGKIIFKPGSGMGWPSLAMSSQEDLFIHESGRYATARDGKYIAIRSNPSLYEQFKKDALEKASTFYKSMGFQDVTFEQGCFVLSKSS